MKELAVQSAQWDLQLNRSGALDLEFQQLLSESGSNSQNTEWNGMTILDGGMVLPLAAAAVARLSTLQVGSGSGQTMDVVFKVLGS